MTVWTVGLLDTYRLERDEVCVARLSTRLWEQLLAYLAVNADRSVPRTDAAVALWPHLDVKYARRRLSHELGNIRSHAARVGMGSNTLLLSPTCVRLNPELAVDVGRFDALVQSADDARDEGERARYLVAARDLYGNGLLPLMGASWLASERQRLGAQHSRIVGDLWGSAMGSSSDGMLFGGPARLPTGEPDAKFVAAMVAFAVQTAEMLGSPRMNPWLMEVDARIDGLHLALEWALNKPDRPSAIAIAGGLWKYWYERGRV